MSQSWYRDDDETNQHLLHQTDPPQFLTTQEVFDKTGVRLWRVERYDDRAEHERVKREGGFQFNDYLEISHEKPDYIEKEKKFSAEHLHNDDEIRLVIAGSGYFDIRDFHDKWIRVRMTAGDLIHLQPGIYHKLSMDSKKYIHMFRLFMEEPKWAGFLRPDGDKEPARATYLSSIPAEQ